MPITLETLAKTSDEAIGFWKKIKKPVVLKISSLDLQHKTDIGGVILDLDDERDIQESFDKLSKLGKANSIKNDIEGIIVSEMVDTGVETVLGVVNDPVFGPTVMFGLGGVFVEVLKDVSFRVAPFDVKEAHMMIDEIRGRAILDGVRGAPPSDIEALAESLSKLSLFAIINANNLDSVDLNPLIVLPKGAKIVDALIITKN
jgi:succinyl-CoA synthetase beta subunit